MKINLIIIIFIFCINSVATQSLPDDVIKSILTNNKTLQLSEARYNSECASANVGLKPPDPEISLGYLLASTSDLGNRIDFSVSQEFDFPTTYKHKNRLSTSIKEQAALQLLAQRQNILSKAEILWIEGIYLNQKREIIKFRFDNAQELLDQYDRKYSLGEINKLELNQIRLKTALLKNELNVVLSEIVSNQNSLSALNGGKEIKINEDKFHIQILFNRDSIIKAYGNSPLTMYFEHQLKIKEREKLLVKAQKLPTFSAGYYSEHILNEDYRGLQIGMSIPLWGKSGTVEKANFEIIKAKSEAENALYKQEVSINQNLNFIENLSIQINELSNTLQLIDSETLLDKSYKAGEISLTDYFYGSDLFFNSKLQLLGLEKEKLQVMAEVKRIFW